MAYKPVLTSNVDSGRFFVIKTIFEPNVYESEVWQDTSHNHKKRVFLLAQQRIFSIHSFIRPMSLRNLNIKGRLLCLFDSIVSERSINGSSQRDLNVIEPCISQKYTGLAVQCKWVPTPRYLGIPSTVVYESQQRMHLLMYRYVFRF